MLLILSREVTNVNRSHFRLEKQLTSRHKFQFRSLLDNFTMCDRQKNEHFSIEMKIWNSSPVFCDVMRHPEHICSSCVLEQWPFWCKRFSGQSDIDAAYHDVPRCSSWQSLVCIYSCPSRCVRCPFVRLPCNPLRQNLKSRHPRPPANPKACLVKQCNIRFWFTRFSRTADIKTAGPHKLGSYFMFNARTWWYERVEMNLVNPLKGI